MLDYIPAEGFPQHRGLSGHARRRPGRERVRHGRAWQDLGVPGAVSPRRTGPPARRGLGAAFSQPPPAALSWEPLEGDGSDRQWFRLGAAGNRWCRGPWPAVDAHLAKRMRSRSSAGTCTGKGLPCRRPFRGRFAGLVFVEDLGDTHLQAAVRAEPDRRRTMTLYRNVIDGSSPCPSRAAGGSTRPGRSRPPPTTGRWCWNASAAIFASASSGARGVDGGLRRFPAMSSTASRTMPGRRPSRGSCTATCSRATSCSGRTAVFHRLPGRPLGPVQYDLASLLIDPYVRLRPEDQAGLYDYALREWRRDRRRSTPDGFRRGYAHCALSRNLQASGAFAIPDRRQG